MYVYSTTPYGSFDGLFNNKRFLHVCTMNEPVNKRFLDYIADRQLPFSFWVATAMEEGLVHRYRGSHRILHCIFLTHPIHRAMWPQQPEQSKIILLSGSSNFIILLCPKFLTLPVYLHVDPFGSFLQLSTWSFRCLVPLCGLSRRSRRRREI